MFLSLVITGFPFAFLLILSYITGIDPALEQAAATLGARPWTAVPARHLPLLAPGLAITFCLSLRAGVLGLPVGGTARRPGRADAGHLDRRLQAAFEEYDYSMASAIAMIMGAVQLVIVVAVLALRGACLSRSRRRRRKDERRRAIACRAARSATLWSSAGRG